MNRISKLIENSKAVICFDDISINASDEHGGPAAIEVETGLFLYSTILRMRPKVIVETGTYKGYSSAWMASALADIQDNIPNAIQKGHLWTVDHNDKQPWNLWESLDISHYITYYVCSSESWEPDFKGKIDFLWLDADHSKNAIIKEFNKFKGQLADYCFVGFHDTWLVPEIAEGIDEIKLYHVPKGYKIEHLYFRNLRGMDMLLLHKKVPAIKNYLGGIIPKGKSPEDNLKEIQVAGLKGAEAGKKFKDFVTENAKEYENNSNR